MVVEPQAQIGAQERRAEFGRQLFAGIAFVAETLAPEIAIKARLMTSRVRAFVRQRGIVALRIPEHLEGRHLDVVQ